MTAVLAGMPDDFVAEALNEVCREVSCSLARP
jgi:hypothetical protein